ncbi:dynein cytoplasmic 1 intermediate chain 2 [Cricetulus griseus]
MSDKSELKAELERKKQRLAQIREEKKRKEEERKKKETDQKKEAAVSMQEESDLEKKRREAEALLQSMGLTTDSPIVPPPMSPSSKSVSTPSEAGSQDSGDGAVGSRRGPIKLGMAKITQVDFPPREIVTYTKETQTPVTAQPKEDEEEEDDVTTPKPPVEPEEEKPFKKDEESDNKAPPHELTEEEKQQILHSEEFLSFFDHSTRIVERALSEQINIFFDYSGRDLEDKEGKAGISEMFEGHQGPITGIHCHAAVGAVDFSHLFVTSSFDWTVKLWTTKNNKPLYSFEDNSDYVYDVMWSPTHPALFACVDGMGRLDLWNLNNDTEVPTASISVEGNPALNRVRWTQSGREIAVGDSEGQIIIYDVGEQIAVPRNDEWARFGRTLAEINANRADAEEEAAARIPA